jgi:transposase
MKEDETTHLSLNSFAADRPVASKTSRADSDTPTRLVAEAVRETVAEHPDAVILPKKQPSFPPQAMLGVVTYCYAKGVLSSSEIERKLWKDPRIVTACPAQIPEAHTIRKFRRLNREVILQALEKSLKRIRRAGSTRTKTLYDLEKESKQVSPLGADAPGEETIMIRRDALDRLNHAARIDSTLRDD